MNLNIEEARRGEIEAQGYSLTPRRYVGVAPPKQEDEVSLAATILANFEELLG